MKQLEKLRLLACQFVDEASPARAHEIGTLVAALDGILPDDGKAISFCAALLLAARCRGIREFSLRALTSEIRNAMRGAL